MSGEVVRRRRKKGGQRRREEEEREEKEEQREEEEPILVTDAAAKEDLTDGGTHSTLVKSLFLAGILGQQLLAPQSGALRISAFRDFHPIPNPYHL